LDVIALAIVLHPSWKDVVKLLYSSEPLFYAVVAYQVNVHVPEPTYILSGIVIVYVVPEIDIIEESADIYVLLSLLIFPDTNIFTTP
jgi:hypothetical protein